MRRLLWTGLGLVVALPLVLLVLLLFVDLDRFSGPIETLLGAALDRQVELDGALDLSVGRTTTLSASDIAIANPAWAEDEHFLLADSLTVELDTASLLLGRVVVNDARLAGIDLDLEERASGEVNWLFGTDEGEEETEADTDGAPDFLVKHLSVEGSRIEYSGPLVEAPLDLALHSVRQTVNERSYLELEVTATLNGEPLEVRMETGELAQLQQLGRVTLSLAGNAGPVEFSLEGGVETLEPFAGPWGRAQLKGPSFRRVAQWLGLRSEADGPLELNASLENTDDHLALALSGSLGTIAAEVRGSIGELATLRQSTLSAEVRGKDLAGFEALLGLPAGSPGAFTVTMAMQPDPGGHPQVNLEGRVADIDLRIEADLRNGDAGFKDSSLNLLVRGRSLATSLTQLAVEGAPATPFELRARANMERESLVVPQIALALGDNTITGSARATIKEEDWSLEAPLTADLTDTGQLLPADASTGDLPDALRSLQFQGVFRADPDTSRLEQVTIAADGVELELGAHWQTADPLAFFGFTLEGAGNRLSGLVPAWPQAYESAFTLDGELTLDQGHRLGGALEVRGDRLSINARPGGHLDDPDTPSRLDIEASVAGSDLAGSIEFTPTDPPRLRVNLASGVLDLRPWIAPGEDAPAAPTQTASAAASPAGSDGRLIPDTDVSDVRLPELEADLAYHADRVEGGLEYIDDLVVKGRLGEGTFTLHEVSFTGQGGGLVRGSMAVGSTPMGLDAWIRLGGENISVGLPAQDPAEIALLPRYDISLAYTATGNTLREMAAGSHGYLIQTSGPGKVDMSAMRMFTQDFLLELLNTVNPFEAKEKYSNIECSVLLAIVEDGVLVGQPVLVVQTDRLQVLADARIDLGTETLEADFNTIPMKGLGIGLSNLINPYVHVSGTLAKPAIGLDRDAAVVSGVTTLATAGISILAKGFYDKVSADKEACSTATAAAEEESVRLETLYGNRRPGVAQ